MPCPVLTSERLILKPLDSSFASENYVSWMNDPVVNKYLESGGDYTMGQLKEYLDSLEGKEIQFWAITLKSGTHIGNIKIDPINRRHRFGEYGILMGDRTEWGKGYAHEASQAVLDFCFSDRLNLRKVNLGVVADNQAAVRLYEKLGFQIEGVLKSQVFHNDKWCDVLRMAIFNPSVIE